MLVENVGSVRAMALDSSVQEEDWQRGETYSAHWHSVSLMPCLGERQSLREVDHQCNQTLSRQWEARKLLQRYLSGAIIKGGLEPQLPLRLLQSTRPQPTYPCHLGVRAPQRPIEDGVHSITTPKRSRVGIGLRVVDLPHVGATAVGFTKNSRSLGRAMSQEAQRG